MNDKKNVGVRPAFAGALFGIVALIGMCVFLLAKPPQKQQIIAEPSPVSAQSVLPLATAETSSVVHSDVNTSTSSEQNGLVTLQLRPTFSRKLPSPEDATNALVMNNQFMAKQR